MAERIDATGEDIRAFMVASATSGFRLLFYDGETPRPLDEVRRILAAFENPAEVLQRHAATVQYMLSQYPDCLTPADYAPPCGVDIDEKTGAVTLSELP